MCVMFVWMWGRQSRARKSEWHMYTHAHPWRDSRTHTHIHIYIDDDLFVWYKSGQIASCPLFRHCVHVHSHVIERRAKEREREVWNIGWSSVYTNAPKNQCERQKVDSKLAMLPNQNNYRTKTNEKLLELWHTHTHSSITVHMVDRS